MQQLRVCWQLLKRDLYVFRGQYVDHVINSIIWPTQAAIMFGYIFPLMGMTALYGANVILATVVYKCLYEAYFQSSAMVADINNLRSVDFFLTLPLPTWLFLAKGVLYFTIKSCLLGFPILFFGKLILLDRFPLDLWAPCSSLLALLVACLFFGLFSILLIGTVRDQVAFEHAWVRCFDVLVMWGSFWIPWVVVHQFAPYASYLMALNPFTLATEALRCSFFGGGQTLPFWPCLGGLFLQALVVGFFAYRSLKKRLDFVD